MGNRRTARGRVLDFGLMDFVSGHHGAIPGSAMKSPGSSITRWLPVPNVKSRRRTGLRGRAVAQRDHRTEGHRYIRNDASAPERIRLSAHVEHSPEPDRAHRRSHAPDFSEVQAAPRS
jgi:citrate lyase subunit beta/citryl-CoA lyase